MEVEVTNEDGLSGEGGLSGIEMLDRYLDAVSGRSGFEFDRVYLNGELAGLAGEQLVGIARGGLCPLQRFDKKLVPVVEAARC